jgi:hypothetical protein
MRQKYTSAAIAVQETIADALDLFGAQCADAALRYASGMSTLLDAADDCQSLALKSPGLSMISGKMSSKDIMAEAFLHVRGGSRAE